MSERRRLPFNDRELEQALQALPAEAIFPPTPDLAGAVADQLRSRSEPRRVLTVRRLGAIAAVLLLMVVAAIMLDSSARETVAGWLGLNGVEVHRVDATPTEIDVPELSDLGKQVSLSEAEAELGFEIQVPSTIDRPPDTIYIDSWPPGGMVSLVYAPSAELPETAFPGVGLLLTEFEGTLAPNAFGKGITAGAELEEVEVNGQRGLWITGAPHLAYRYHTLDGELAVVDARLAGNVLLWESEGLTYRLEAQIPRDQAIAIAESLQPAGP